MQIIAYTNTSDTTVANKNITLIDTFDLTPYNIVDIERPSFILDYDERLVDCNYIKVPAFNRFYFVTGAVNKGSQVILECLSDPLTSFISALQNCDITVIRSSSVNKPTMYPDTKLPIYPNKKVVSSITKAETGGNFSANGNYCYVLNVIGGAPITNE